MCTVLLPPDDNPVAANKCIIYCCKFLPNYTTVVWPINPCTLLWPTVCSIWVSISCVTGVSSRMEFGFYCVLPPSRRKVIFDVPTGVTVRSAVSWRVTPWGLWRCSVGLPLLHEDGAAGSSETSVKFMMDTTLHSREQHSSNKIELKLIYKQPHQ